MLDLKSMTKPELEEIVLQNGFQKYRAKQIYEKLQNGGMNISECNIPKDLKQFLKENYFVAELTLEERYVSKKDNTEKYLFRLYDGEIIEAVLMEYRHGNTLCISTQVGCRMGCRFCASTIGGLNRNLLPSEMLSQIQMAEKVSSKKVSNIVMMGIGEPFDNFTNVKKFLNLLYDPIGTHIGARHISISTCGDAEGIRELAEMKSQITLSVSLHAPNDEIRNQMMPINKKYNIEQLISECKRYIKKTNRRISFEYAMVKDVNDSKLCAEMLSKLLSGMLCHVNLIPVNKISEREYSRSEDKTLNAFLEILRKNQINATIRRTLGSDINASCGQLRRERKLKEGC